MTKNYRRNIDSLRAISVLSVIFFYLNLPYFEGGFLGVDIFFVIGGFLITKIILIDKFITNVDYFKNYK
jgi:peptidoglycan/LPS O-acetylase OafA/YrhL